MIKTFYSKELGRVTIPDREGERKMDKTVLKNGAKIMEIQKCKDTGYVVLAMKEKRNKDGFIEYVTWLTDDELNCFHGNYFVSSINAVKDYEKRVNQYCSD